MVGNYNGFGSSFNVQNVFTTLKMLITTHNAQVITHNYAWRVVGGISRLHCVGRNKKKFLFKETNENFE